MSESTAKEERSSRGEVDRPRKRCRRKSSTSCLAADLFVPLAISDPRGERSILIHQLSQRLSSSGYKQAAFTHTVYGKPKDPVDRVDTNLSEQVLCIQTDGKSSKAPGLKILRRIHAVIENLSDVGGFIEQSANAEESRLVQEYDIISIAPQNESVFRSVISSATACDIVTLDYTVQRSGLPFRLRAADIRTIVERQLVLEIPYAPALLQPAWRRAWIQTCAEMQQVSRGQKLMVLLSSSGNRAAEQTKDASVMAIRMPKDVQNLATAVLGFSNTPLGVASDFVLAQAQKRRFGTNIMAGITVGEPDDDDQEVAVVDKASGVEKKPASKQPKVTVDTLGDADEGPEDGFIAF